MVQAMLLNTPQATRALGVSRTTMHRLIKEGRLKPVHIGRAVRFAAEDLEAFVEGLRNNREAE